MFARTHARLHTTPPRCMHCSNRPFSLRRATVRQSHSAMGLIIALPSSASSSSSSFVSAGLRTDRCGADGVEGDASRMTRNSGETHRATTVLRSCTTTNARRRRVQHSARARTNVIIAFPRCRACTHARCTHGPSARARAHTGATTVPPCG